MTDMEKVLQALEHCDLCSDMPNCPGCAYLRELNCMEHLKRDIIALLKAQEPIEARLNLCESCTKEYAECEADKADLVYGSGVGNDNIIGCPWYMNRWKAQKQEIEDLKQEIEGHKDNLRETLDEMMRYADELKAQEQKCRECGEATSKAIQELQTKLKAQEPVEPLKMAVDHVRKEPVVFSYECPVCMCGLQRHWVACPICGTGVKF